MTVQRIKVNFLGGSNRFVEMHVTGEFTIFNLGAETCWAFC
jgi:hypothetical protein